MELELPVEHPQRDEVRAFLAAFPEPTGRQLAEAGYVAPHWPPPWGKAAGPIEQLLIEDELRRAGVRKPDNPIGIGWAGPTLIEAGSAEQKERYLPALLSGEEFWCQLFSEPGAGSDLAGLTTRAVRDGDSYVVNGQKLWTSGAHRAAFGILIARSDPAAPKRRGITYLICPMDAPGITVRPIVDMTGAHSFNEVFFDDVRIPLANRVGEENDGWRLAKVTLGNERVSLSAEGALWGHGPTAADLVALVVEGGGLSDKAARQELAALYSEGEILAALRHRYLAATLAGRAPGPEASLRKALADSHGQRLMAFAKELAGAAGMLAGAAPAGSVDPIWSFGFLFSPALTIGGGTAEVQRDIIAERLLGLPEERQGEGGPG